MKLRQTIGYRRFSAVAELDILCRNYEGPLVTSVIPCAISGRRVDRKLTASGNAAYICKLNFQRRITLKGECIGITQNK